MRLVLKRHPDSDCVAATQIDVELARPCAARLMLSYVVTGNISDLRLPPVVAAGRSDDLWRQTCFEAFVGTSPGAAYYEFNFSPSTQWAVYRFGSYRNGMHVALEVSGSGIAVQSTQERYTLQAALNLAELSGLRRDAGWRLGLAAVIEDRRGRKAYWALEHPPGKPDFHHFDCFAHDFSPA